jgi:membrane fusion protein, copper/silver efflux system
MKIVIQLFIMISLLLSNVMAQEQKYRVKQLFSVQTISVKKQTFEKKIKNHGYVRVDDSRTYDVTPRFGGYVVTLYANTIYKKVKKGEALAVVYSPEVFKAKDEYLNAYNYAQKRNNQGMVDSAKLKLQLLGISDEEIASVIINKKASANTTLYAPIDGYIFVKNINNGSAFSVKSQLFEIVNLDEVWIESQVFEAQRSDLESVTKYNLYFNGIKQAYTTKQKFLYPVLDSKVATLTLRLCIKNTNNKLFPGMYANVIGLKESTTKLLLPASAVIHKNGKHYVFIVSEFEGEYEPLEVGITVVDTNTYSVDSGLVEGDKVVNNALFMMDSDAQINGLY